jgi:hypothetical protein
MLSWERYIPVSIDIFIIFANSVEIIVLVPLRIGAANK